MKQPDLGKKITELRKAKGLTQEELVEKCNISVRTIQRIESGEVMPRSYTVKTILTALDHNLSDVSISEDESPQPTGSWFKDFIRFDADTLQPPNALSKILAASWMCGIVYFVLGFFEGLSEYFRFEEDTIAFGTVGYILIKVAVLVSYIIFQRGFILLGGLYNNTLLRTIALVLIAVKVVLTGYDIISLFYDSGERILMIPGISVTYGALGILFGVALRRLEKPFGRAAELAGIFEIAAALFFVTVVLAFIGFMALVPAELCEIIILFKAMELMKSRGVQLVS